MTFYKSIPTLNDVSTLIDMLAYRAEHTPDKDAFIYDDLPVLHSTLWENVNRTATFLQSLDVGVGDRVLIIIPNGPEFFNAFYGVQRAGAISVPLFPGSGARRILSILNASEAKVVILPSDTPTEMLETYKQGVEAFGCKLVTADQCVANPVAEDAVLPDIAPDQLAFLQYTSGSTGNSKGVMLTHANLVANLRQMIAGSLMTDQDVVVSWLPVYHDLGLILMTMAPFYIGARLVLLPTTLTKLNAWADAITRYKGTYTAAPDIGYRMLVRQVHNPEQYDLSSLRIAINAAEPVRARTIEEFHAKFNLPSISKPSYGLAEASVGVTFWGVETQAIKVDDRGHVAIGYALPDVQLKIVVDDREAAVGEVGELVLKSPSATHGYFRNPEATENLFWGDGWVRTGDLAYFDADGDLFMVARRKNIIKHSGRTIAPREIEEIVDDLSGVRYTAVVGVNHGDAVGEQAYVFAETRLSAERAAQEGAEVVREIVQRIHERLGFRPGRVYLVAKNTIPFTYNGKIRHVELRDAYLSGELKREGKLLYPEY